MDHASGASARPLIFVFAASPSVKLGFSMAAERSDVRRSGIWTAFALFSAFALCANLASAIHEFGHALGAWLGGVRIAEWYLRPFDFSRVEIESQGASLRGIMLWSGGGIFFGVLLPLPLLLIVRCVKIGSL